MSRIKVFTITTTLIILSTAFAIYNYNWKIAKGYDLKFSTESASGKFETVSGNIVFDETNLETSSFKMSIDVSSIATGNFIKNSHARGDGWFDADKYPNISFVSTKIIKTNTGYLVTGNLTMHGTTHQINIPFTFSKNIFKGNFSVNRMDYKIGTLEGMSKKVGNKVDLQFSIPVIK